MRVEPQPPSPRGPAGARDDRHVQLRFRPGAMPPLFGDTAATLIVDDDPVVADLLAEVLGDQGYDCTIAHSALEARALISERTFAVALVDVMMAGENGLELADDLLGKYEDLAVVMVTGVDDPKVAELALESGAAGYVVKPFSVNQVVITVNNASRMRCLEIERRVQRARTERVLADRTADLGDALGRLERRAPDERDG